MYAKLKTIMIAFVIMFITAAIIFFPERALDASVHGLHTWWEIVFPSLLPFFIMAELLISFGIVQFFGVLFEPIMRPLFNVPGSGSFAWILGMVSGFPSGAKITVLLREKNEVSHIEAERLISFSNAASPLFIFGAIAVGFFHNVQLGIIIAISHYMSNILVGILMRYYAKEKGNNNVKHLHNKQSPEQLIRRAFSHMHRTRISESRPFGQLFGDAVLSSVQTLLVIGGFIILFSVFTSLLQVIHIIELIQLVSEPLFRVMNIPSDIIPSLVTGFFEITMGAEAVSNSDALSIAWQLVLVSFILGFNGFSIQAQVASLIAKTDIRFYPYFISRIVHAFMASLITYLLFSFYFKHQSDIIDTIHIPRSLLTVIYELTTIVTTFGPLLTISSLFIATIILFRKLSST